MKFCEKCGSILQVERKRKNVYLFCPRCKSRTKVKGEELIISEVLHKPKKEVAVMSKEELFAELPKTKIICPRCENTEAYWWMQQTRAADEPPTIFYRCTHCGYSWRTYG